MSRFHRQNNGWKWEQVRQAILARDDYRCTFPEPHNCNAARGLQVDHIVPLSRGGARYDPANLRTVCRNANAGRNRRLPTVDDSFT